ncbi:MAG: M20/M25/M40 family metallo-hydrolase [bacterium]|nr:M20/M25/M40 family metallo-hydrolase [bacterium]
MSSRHVFLILGMLAALLPAELGAEPSTGAETNAVTTYRQAHEAAILRGFAELLSMPNVASDTENIRRNAEYIRGQLEQRGARAKLWQVEGAPPIVFGELEAPNATRTLGIYVHYDGQPVDRANWTHPPFEPVLYTAAIEAGGEPRPFPEDGEPVDPEWRIYARSAGDDKAPLPALFAALDALAAAGIPRSSNLKFLFEGEEEAGSPHLRTYLETHRDRLDVDLWLICDGPAHQSRRPQLVFGVRGVTGFEITVYGATRNLHSGHYGNWSPNPALMLAQLLAGMKDDDGKVLVEGFYDSTAQVGEAERAAIAALPPVDEALRKELGLAASEGGGELLAERLLLPSLNIRGFQSGGVAETARNVIPNTATASLDVRLAKGNEPQAMVDLVEAHVRRQGYHVVREDPDLETRLAHPRIAKIEREGGYKAARTEMDLAVVRDVIGAAERAAGESLVLMPTLGGSLPLYLFTDLLAMPVVIVPIANHDNNQHAPDENLRLANLWYGIDLMGSLLTMD